ncbi:DMT family transporter [Ornithinicoccus hortensis]|uniref:Transporter family-2 protein n=1 Tax=Ornithinicoccus hortensis TaxID=82346 RepID=A0A542YM81_9MICO|nr:DMT family transporter [Ornithinicoccus hortensis]TQL49196.1 transporter family-2 protein [Ornithinicoccus hortensis]
MSLTDSATPARGSHSPSSTHEAPRWLRVLAVPGMLLVGVIVAVQSHVNGQLREELGSGLQSSVLTAMMTFCVGCVLTALVVASMPGQRRRFGHFRRSLGTPVLPWRLIWGGALGALFVISQAVAVGPLGLAVFTMAIVLGQTAGGAGADRVGLGPGGRQPLSPARLIAAATALVAVVLAGLGAGDGPGGATGTVLTALVVFTVVAGVGTAVQQALNGRVGAVAGPYVAAWLNTAVGSVVLVVVLGVALLLPGEFAGWPDQWWLYTGGPLGISFIALSAALVRVHGVLVLMLCTIAGQMATAWALAVAGAGAVPWTTHLATTLVLLGVGIALLTRRRVAGRRGLPPA